MAGQSLYQRLAAGEIVLGDGAMGTMLQAAGLAGGGASELWNVERPERIRAIHTAYIEAGAQIVETNTFGGTALRLRQHGLDGRVFELNRAGAALARAAVGDSGMLVAGSIGPTGELLEPLGALSSAEAQTLFAEQARGLVDGGVDMVLIETMSDLSEVEAAVLGVRSVAPELLIAATMTFGTKGRTMMGVRPGQALAALHGWGVRLIGANCGNGPGEIAAVMSEMAQQRPDGVYLIAQSNAGLPHDENGKTVFDGTPEVMADYALRMRDLGINIIGACCGSTPAHIAAMGAALAQGQPVAGSPLTGVESSRP